MATRAYREPKTTPSRTTPKGRPRSRLWSRTAHSATTISTTSTRRTMLGRTTADRRAAVLCQIGVAATGVSRPGSLGFDARGAGGDLSQLEPAPAIGGDEVALLAVSGSGLGVPEHVLGRLDGRVRARQVPHSLGAVVAAERGQAVGPVANVGCREHGPGRLQLVEGLEHLVVGLPAAVGQGLTAGGLFPGLGGLAVGVAGGILGAQLGHAEEVAVDLVGRVEAGVAVGVGEG